MKEKTLKEYSPALFEAWNLIYVSKQPMVFYFATKGKATHWKQQMYMFRKQLRIEAPEIAENFERFGLETEFMPQEMKHRQWKVTAGLSALYQVLDQIPGRAEEKKLEPLPKNFDAFDDFLQRAGYGTGHTLKKVDGPAPWTAPANPAPTDAQIASLYDIPPKKENEGNDGGT